MNNDKGVFTAPLRGVYHFHFGATQIRDDHQNPASSNLICNVQVLKNGAQVVAVALADSSADGVTVYVKPFYGQATLLLEAGDTVTTKLLKHCTLLSTDGILAMFLGFLIVPLPTVYDFYFILYSDDRKTCI